MLRNRLFTKLRSFKTTQRSLSSINASKSKFSYRKVVIASAVATIGIGLWSKSYFADSKDKYLNTNQLQQDFNTFASDNDNGQTHMNFQDLLNYVGSDTFEESSLKVLFDAVKEKNGLIDLKGFLELNDILRSPDAEYRIAFKIADKDHDGYITKEEFQEIMKNRISENTLEFNWGSDWVNLFFGRSGKAQLTYLEFCQLLAGLPSEQVRQEFTANNNSDSGLVSSEVFLQILKNSRVDLPTVVNEEKITALAKSNVTDKRGEGISYAQYKALYNLLIHLPSYAKILSEACRITGKEKITQDEFLAAASSKTTIDITPLECALVFHFFDKKEDGLLDWEEFRFITEEAEKAAAKPQQHRSVLESIQHSCAQFGLGGIAGGIGATAVYPIDLVKTRMQNQRTSKGAERLYKHSFDCFFKVIRNEGFAGLYKGLGPQLVGVAPEKAIKLTVNDFLRDFFSDQGAKEIYFPLECVAGGGAGASQVIFTNPLEIVKIRLQVQGEAVRKGVITATEKQGAVTIMKELGFTGLYKGAGACLLRDVPFSAIYFPVYAKMKKDLSAGNAKASPAQLLLAGAIAGVPAAGLVTPADVIKTRLQVKAQVGEQTYDGIVDCARKVLQAEGFTAFWKGALARVFRSSPQFGVTLLSYELLQRVFGISTDTPPTNAPVTAEEMYAFHSISQKMQIVEQKWFDVFKTYRR